MLDNALQQATDPVMFSEKPQVQTLLEQGTGLVNEDAQLVRPGLYGVFDGATSLGGKLYGGVTGGYLASSLAAQAFDDAEGSLKDAAGAANTAIQQAMVEQQVDVSRKENRWSTSCAVVRIAGNVLEWCQTGDCRILLLYADGSHQEPVQPSDQDAETLRLWQKMAPKSREPIHVALADHILQVRRRVNVDFGALNGEPEALDFVRHGTLELAGVAAVLLYTDGLCVPAPASPLSHSPDLLARMFAADGLDGVHNHIRRLQQCDPHCRQYPRFKASDDISAIALYQ